ncbi:hypothetical protein ILYODFUR_000423 [Ilyodon furcidens]|uniref:Uncharacterized protein n=1 Tax=Ilyodon furcidens TaxID=33524 RepID=A0ABV0VAU0_9TELE
MMMDVLPAGLNPSPPPAEEKPMGLKKLDEIADHQNMQQCFQWNKWNNGSSPTHVMGVTQMKLQRTAVEML